MKMLYLIGKLCSLFLVVALVTSKSVPMLRDDDDDDEGGMLMPEDFKNVGNRHNEDNPEDEDRNPDFYEGDCEDCKAEDRDAVFNKTWPKGQDGLVTVPYTIPSDFSSKNKEDLAKVITEYEEKTCVR